jgi:hypothetical protein
MSTKLKTSGGQHLCVEAQTTKDDRGQTAVSWYRKWRSLVGASGQKSKQLHIGTHMHFPRKFMALIFVSNKRFLFFQLSAIVCINIQLEAISVFWWCLRGQSSDYPYIIDYYRGARTDKPLMSSYYDNVKSLWEWSSWCNWVLLFTYLLANETPNSSVNVNGFSRLTGGGESESDIV